MRTTLRIDEELIRDLREIARKERSSLNQLLNRVIRRGLNSDKEKKSPSKYCENVVRLGEPKLPLHKALALVDALEGEQIQAKLATRK